MASTIMDVQFSTLMDLRVDYAFKLFFGTGDTSRLVSLINAVFENKGIPRVITDLTVVNPSLEKQKDDDKLSVLDIRASLPDGSSILIEMHLYQLPEFKYKSVRSWARAYGESLVSGNKYTLQKPVICISFLNGAIDDVHGQPIEKIHSLFHLMERDDHQVLLSDAEFHFINMSKFVKALIGEWDTIDANTVDKFTRWLALITEKEIADKDILKQLCEKEDEMMSAVTELARLSTDAVRRQEYQRRLDELYSYNLLLEGIKEAEQRADTAEQQAEVEKQRADTAEQQAEAEKQRADTAELAAKEQQKRIAELEELLKKLQQSD